MSVFLSTLNQMTFLLLLIAIGYTLVKLNVLKSENTLVLSRLENNVFIPALVMGTFIDNLTVNNINTAWQYILGGLAVVFALMPISIFSARILAKDDKYIRNIYTYSLCFPNFGFMGNAVVLALFPDYFVYYLIFVLPFWVLIYVWGVPSLLIPKKDGAASIKARLKPLINPMFICMLIGMVIGLSGIKLPSFISTSITSLGSCMSPIAMVLTGMTIAKINLIATFKSMNMYVVSAIKLLFIPLIVLIVLTFINIPYGVKLCSMCAVAMPLGLNTIVVPSAYGKDTSVGAGLALISHLLSAVTIPIIFMLFDLLVK